MTTWSPSHGALIVDEANRVSINFHPLPEGRFALSRTCEGTAEYSGRGGRQLYTHALVIDAETLARSGHQPLAIYRDAMALGYLRYQAEPAPMLKPVRLSSIYSRADPSACSARARELGFGSIESTAARLRSDQSITFSYGGDRIELVECLLGVLPPEIVPKVSFATSLQPSAVRPYRLLLVTDRREPAPADSRARLGV